MQNTFRRNLFIGFGASLLILIVSSVISFLSITGLLESAANVNHTNDIIIKLDSTLSLLKDAETGQRGYLLSDDDRFLEPFYGAAESSLQMLKNIKTLTSDNKDQQTACLKNS